MDLIYTDKDKYDLGVLEKYSLDTEDGVITEDCTFEIQTVLDINIVNNAKYWYIENTSYGGIIDEVKVTTAKKTIALKGRTWRGLLGSKIIEPAQGQAYYTISGELNECIATVIQKVGLQDFIHVSDEDTGININYQFNRYTDAYMGLLKMLNQAGYKMDFRWSSGYVIISAIPIIDYSNERELTSDLFDFVIEKNSNPVNHMIGLGSGELADRMVVHKYLQSDGTVGDAQYYTGIEERTATYDYSSVESLEELEKGTIEQLEELVAEADTLKLTANNLEADLMDMFTAHDIYTDISIKEYITNKIVKIDKGKTKISYKVGNVK